MKIKFIELQKPKLTVDIEVENTHSYLLSNGIISHNTVGKMMETTEGIHKPLSKYIFNNIIISKASPLLKVAIDAGYRHFFLTYRT